MASFLSLRISPGARHEKRELLEDGSWKVWLRARAVEGEANDALLKKMAQILRIPQTSITLHQGKKSRQKLLKIEQLDEKEIHERLLLVD